MGNNEAEQWRVWLMLIVELMVKYMTRAITIATLEYRSGSGSGSARNSRAEIQWVVSVYSVALSD